MKPPAKKRKRAPKGVPKVPKPPRPPEVDRYLDLVARLIYQEMAKNPP